MESEQKTLSIVIPVYNEAKTIRDVLEHVKNSDIGNIKKEIILVDDFSTDGSRDVLKKMEEEYKIVFHEKNKGKGAAIKSGFAHATGDFVIIQDSDLELDPNDYHLLLQPLLENSCDVVFGNRFSKENRNKLRYVSNFWGARLLSWVSNILTGLRLSDVYVGYKVFKRNVVQDILPRLKSDRFAIEAELTARVKKFKVCEVSISYFPRTFEEGKKIRWTDGVKGLWAILRFNLFDF